MRPLDAFGPGSWARPEAIAFGRLPMATHLGRDDEGMLSLDGPWRFTLVPKPESVSPDHLDGDTARWATIQVPGCWTMQGFDRPHYTNVQMPFPGPPPSVPRHNPTGVYRNTVTIPDSWDGRRVVLHVGAAETVLYVFVDGVAVGMGKDSRLPHEFDITRFVTAGQGVELALVVVRWSDATYLEDQDHWHHAGLHRSVFVYATPVVHIADVHAIADYDRDELLASLTAHVIVDGRPASIRNWRVRVACGGASAEAAARFEHESWVVNSFAFEGRGATVSFAVPAAAPWTAETPHLHALRVELVDGGGTVVDCVGLDVGFRRVEIVDAQLKVNGRPILVRGVNRHDTDARRGKAVTRSSIERDVALMQQHNFNAIRTAHYPNDPYLYEVCDRMGMYVLDEANIESHAYLRALTKQPAWTAAMLERVARMARRDKNHPSVIMWSLGNESGVSPAHHAAAAWLRAYDTTRPVHYEGGISEDQMAEGGQSYRPEILGRDRPETDVIAPMYPPVDALIEWAQGGPPVKPLIMCEYIHAMGNSCGDAEAYWDAIRAHSGLQGGFVWDWADQALVQTMPDGSERLAYGGDFGDYPHDGAFCMNGLVDTNRVPHPSLYELAHVMSPVQIRAEGDGFRVTNEYAFTDLSHPLLRAPLGPGESTFIPAAPDDDIVTVYFGVVAAQIVRRLPDDAPDAMPSSTRGVATSLSLWRAPIDNETFGGGHAARWKGLDFARIDLVSDSDGDVVSHTVVVPEEFDDIARVGVRLDVGAGVQAVDWFGRGPHENYSDRCASARYGRFTTAVDDWPVPYVHPQSSGNRTGVRWLRLLDANDEPILVIDRMGGLNVVVSRYTDEQIDAVEHLEELPASDDCYVYVSVRERGVGSGACGPDVSDPHRIRPGTYTWSYRLR
ncbi:MAG TPA: glycoside hydrolase family 2 TIM barrel-domain containing protein [Acidimicrobiales bacterium]|nr:glycoside hydrolase family 2 TIM barrel-domain containing protein [Acidimicrobiales bacterium]